LSWRQYLAAKICAFADRLYWLGERVYYHAGNNFDGKTLWRTDNPLFRQIANRLRNGERICLIYVDIVKFHEIESIYGPQTCSRILRLLPAVLKEAAGNFSIGPLLFLFT
jgi:GGDEF domain-containing protein